MKCVILAVLATVALADHSEGIPPSPPEPNPSYIPPAATRAAETPVEVVPILKDERTNGEDGSYSVDTEEGNGIVKSEQGSPSGPEGAVVKTGEYSYTAPDGSAIKVAYVADENGFQPQSDALPVAPEFPHEIPEFVQEQIARAAEEDAAQEADAAARAAAPPSYQYNAPSTAPPPPPSYLYNAPPTTPPPPPPPPPPSVYGVPQ